MTTDASIHENAAIGSGMDRRVQRSRRSSWRLGALIVLVVLIAGFSLWRFLPEAGSTDVASGDAEIGEVTQGPFEDFLPLRATVVPRLTTLVGVLSGGQVAKLLVQDGALVSDGQPLAMLANPELRLDVLTREAQIASQLGGVAGEDLGIERNRLDRAGQIAQANYDLIKARRDLAIRQQLHAQGILSDEGVKSYAEEAAYQEKRLAQLQAGGVAQAHITATQGARLSDTRGRLERNLTAVRAGLDALVIRAPVGGRLTNFNLQPGQALKPGDPAGQVDSEGTWKLTADVDEYYLGRVVVGQIARTGGGVSLTVSKVLPAVKDGRFRIELMFNRSALSGLSRGQTVDIRIMLGGSSSAIVAPVGGWLDSGGGNSAFVVAPDGAHARRSPVKTGRRNADQVEIVSGLKPGQRIIISNTAAVKGDVLNIR